MFPQEFERSVNAELGEAEAGRLLAALDGRPVTSIRYNPFKLSAMPTAEGGGLPCGNPVPWNRYGAYLAARPVFTLDPAMHAGLYYVQEASSQFVEHLLRESLTDRDGELPGNIRLLDLCAAPGGKTTLYSTLAGPEGLVVANEVVKQRASVLADNVRRWGVGNVAVTCNEPRDFAAYKHWFDVLAVDAPCSGEGMFRRLPESRSEWSPAGVEMCASRGRGILADAWDALKPGGILIYSTCTFNRRENEETVAWLAENYAVEPVAVDVPEEWGVVCGDAAGIRTFRFWPHLARGEGFFAAVMRKADGRVKRETPRARKEPLVEMNRPESKPLAEWVNTPEAMKFARVGDNCYGYYRPVYRDVVALAGGLNVIYSGVCMGRIFNGKLRPDHALALFHDLAPGCGTASKTEITRDETLDYLRKKEFADPSRLAEGLNLLTHGGVPVGWTKRVGHRSNTMLPNSFRIVNL
ncbi:MAG: rRNA cytosine-C5-methylase [Alistipes sp.]|jgi:16S rRNA C967 or C1407 C5-methylase (RsmB/RsmF family)/NOL1/NOP2/fmu family ribosome biogenesis protein|nr:rRNA cytosine-C5-methylase [Alistipes sp.]